MHALVITSLSTGHDIGASNYPAVSLTWLWSTSPAAATFAAAHRIRRSEFTYSLRDWSKTEPLLKRLCVRLGGHPGVRALHPHGGPGSVLARAPPSQVSRIDRFRHRVSSRQPQTRMTSTLFVPPIGLEPTLGGFQVRTARPLAPHSVPPSRHHGVNPATRGELGPYRRLTAAVP